MGEVPFCLATFLPAEKDDPLTQKSRQRFQAAGKCFPTPSLRYLLTPGKLSLRIPQAGQPWLSWKLRYLPARVVGMAAGALERLEHQVRGRARVQLIHQPPA